MYPTRWLIAAGVLAFLLGLALYMPARFALAALPLNGAGLVVQGASGSLSNGEARLASTGGPFRVAWDLEGWRLLLLQLAADWKVDARELRAEGHGAVAPWGGSMTIARLDLSARGISQWTGQWQAGVDRPLAGRDLHLSFSPTGRARDASGALAWGPGTLTLAGRPPVQVPALRGRLLREEAVLVLQVDGENAPGQELAFGRFDTEAREMQLALLQRGAGLLGERMPARSPETVVFEMKQAFR